MVDLRNRVSLYHSYFANAQYNKMWELSSKRLRGQNDNDKTEFINYIQKLGFSKTKIKFNILSLDINNGVAKAKVEISIWMDEKDTWLSEIQNQIWIFENGNWFFDDYKVENF